MRPFEEMPASELAGIGYVLTDIDDTITTEGRFPATSLAAMEELEAAGVKVIPVTGRPAGWCDPIARMWPVAAVVGETGAMYFPYDRASTSSVPRSTPAAWRRWRRKCCGKSRGRRWRVTSPTA